MPQKQATRGPNMPNKLLATISLAALAAGPGVIAQTLPPIDTIVVIYAENRSFDHLYGNFPGAEGLAQATPEQRTQLDQDRKSTRLNSSHT